ncbi:hypothetical protein [Zunongwangia pacifica]|uniref:Uncharacterized protein n=2 Tax=Flavobacteriaceae TaxID=49546 RepID=A0A223V8D5_9FLAO|nr:hypothetical protein [Zunongwangia pacifica]ASV31562.1 hypothetical protein CJ263_15820 [Maribacter cobaltidurans]MCL6219323.1 hypothetical protein [Zunongwangia pacifica]
MEFDRFPNFLGNKRAREMGTGGFGVGSKTFVMKRFSRKGAFRKMQGNGLSGMKLPFNGANNLGLKGKLTHNFFWNLGL